MNSYYSNRLIINIRFKDLLDDFLKTYLKKPLKMLQKASRCQTKKASPDNYIKGFRIQEPVPIRVHKLV